MFAKAKQTTMFARSAAHEERRCPAPEQLVDWAHRGSDHIPPQQEEHIESCPKCAFDFTVWRAANCLSQLPSSWLVHFGAALREWQTSNSFETRQLLGTISLETQRVSLCQHDDWMPSPSAMRVNLVLDEKLHFFSFTVLDVPLAVESISLMTSHGLRHFEQTDDGLFELFISDESTDCSDYLPLTFSDIWAQVTAHKLQLAIGMKGDSGKSTGSRDAVEILEQYQVIERTADYKLPSGLHCDTYVNVAALCAHEDAMQLMAAKFDFLFWDTYFDTVLANGWAMSLIARRLVDARQTQGRKEPIHQLQSEGYDDPTLLNDILPGSQVLLILDVIVTATLTKKLIRLVQANGADVVGVAVLVKPHGREVGIDKLRSLCELEMQFSATRIDDFNYDQPLPQFIFNPIAGYMTTKTTEPRSPSDFLDQDAHAREFWEYVSAADAYEHHRREGDTHYIAFIDTQKLLQKRNVGANLVAKLVELIHKSNFHPNILFVPFRARARLLASRLSKALTIDGRDRPRIVYTQKNRKSGRWFFSPKTNVSSFLDSRVCIVDTAVGHGRTIDQLALLAAKLQANSIGAATLLSRLTPPCEEAFGRRLSGGFHRLYNLPIRPVAIRGDRLDLCPICRRKNAIKIFAERADIDGLEKWADHLLHARRGPAERQSRPRERQKLLFDNQLPFLSSCAPAVASGVTLHALGSATTNGGAPLILPELSDDRIPWRVRATIVENLPAGILQWTGNTLVADLVGVLSGNAYPAIWKATANLLSREGNDAWLDHLGPMLSRLQESNHRTSPAFWNHMACNAFVLTAAGDQVRNDFHARIDELLTGQFDDVVENGLRQIKELVSD